MLTRRRSLQLLQFAGLAPLIGCAPRAEAPQGAGAVSAAPESGSKWGRGFEGQRIADRGDATFLNPIFSGDRPDPSIIKDGDRYYVTFSSFDNYPALMIWESQDLVNWSPVGPALETYIGSVWAPDLVRHDGKYYLYIPARTEDYKSIYVVTASDIRGPWSEPVDLKLTEHIDPGHIVGEDGKRYLFLSNGDMVRLTDDGLATDGPVQHVYDPWRYPEDWDVECFCPEGPKMLRRGEWFYMLTAVGGTAGPPTGHMVIAARSRSVFGPWEDAPNNPQVRTESRDEAWWSRGHATLIEGPSEGDWYLIYHGYEKDFWTLGRQCLLEPVRWTEEGWFEALGGDLSKPFPIPKGGRPRQHGVPLSDQFEGPALKPQWAFYRPGGDEKERVSFDNGGLRLAAKGVSPKDATPLCLGCGDRAYSVEVEIEREPGVAAGLLLFYSSRLYCGFGLDDEALILHRYGDDGYQRGEAVPSREHFFLRLENDEHVVTAWISGDGDSWRKLDRQLEVSGYHHNVAWEFLSLRPALYAAGEGGATFRNFRYRALR